MNALQQIVCFGVSHQTAPVSVREHIYDLIVAFATDLPPYVMEHALLSTCNRVELYMRVETIAKLPNLSNALNHNPADDQSYTYMCQGQAAAEHLYRVSAGLDSLVLGEPQILGQVRQTAAIAQKTKTAGRALQLLLSHAIIVGKRARTETAISHSPASVSSVSINLAQKTLGALSGKQIVIVGLGEMGRLVLKALRHRRLRDIILVNRTRATAEQLADPIDSVVCDWEELPQALLKADLLFCATGAAVPLITAEQLTLLAPARHGRPLVAIDLAVPRNIETAVDRLPHTQLFDMDNLHSTLDDALASRKQEVPQVEGIIKEELETLGRDLQTLAVQPLISDLRQQVETIRQRELQRTLRHLGQELDPETRKHIEHLSRSLINKVLHQPMSHLRQRAETGEDVAVDMVRHLFGLGE